YQLLFNLDDISQQQDAKLPNTLWITVKFTIKQLREVKGDEWKDYKIVIKERGQESARVGMPKPVPPPVREDLSLVLAMDYSGSMKEPAGSVGGKTFTRIDKARDAAYNFLFKLPYGAPCGLILFDHEMKRVVPPILDHNVLAKFVLKEEPSGGTAY